MAKNERLITYTPGQLVYHGLTFNNGEKTMSNTDIIEHESETSLPTQTQQQSTSVSATPAQLLSMAVQQGADLDKLEKLMDLQERYERNEAKKAFDEAMNEFQSRMPIVPKRGNVDYTSPKGRTAYDFGRLEDAVAKASPILKDVGLSFRFKQESTTGGLITVTCVISHRLGHYEENSMSAMPDTSGGKDPIKAMASTNSYLRRYTFTGGFGIVFSGEDDENQMIPATHAPQQNSVMLGFEQIKQETELNLKAILEDRGAKPEQYLKWMSGVTKCTITKLSDLSENQGKALIKQLEDSKQ
ncbi:essential recombination function protein [Vibrio phage vB_VpM-pA2SJ1]|uniref:Essential recombination function protein n=1 Tax=Vibrio phage vB_VpM-pA2SJ1 TaxID=3095964 RepID=A0AAX4J5N7_9CAUD